MPFFTKKEKLWARKEKAIRYKGNNCQKCNMSIIDSPWVCDFHHTNPSEKEFNICSLLRIKDWNVIQLELDKCILLCANCHRKCHFNITDYDKSKKNVSTLLTGDLIETLYQRKSTCRDKNKAKTLYENGLSYEEISEIMKFEISTIRGWCPKGIVPVDLNASEMENKIINYYNNGVSTCNMSILLKCKNTRMYKKVNEMIKNGKLEPREERYQNQYTKNTKKVSIDGIVYKNIQDASKKLNINYTTVKYRVLSKQERFSKYFYVS